MVARVVSSHRWETHAKSSGTSAKVKPPPASACGCAALCVGNDDGRPETERLDALAGDDAARCQVDGHAGMGQQAPQVGPREHRDHAPQDASSPDGSRGIFDDHDLQGGKPGREPGHHGGRRVDVGCTDPVREDEDVAGEPEPIVPVRRREGIDRHVQADEVRIAAVRRVCEFQRGDRALIAGRRRDRVDGVFGGVVPEEGERGLIGLIDDDGGRRREVRRPCRFVRGGPRSVTPDAGSEQVESPVGLRRPGREKGRRRSPGSSGMPRRPRRGSRTTAPSRRPSRPG